MEAKNNHNEYKYMLEAGCLYFFDCYIGQKNWTSQFQEYVAHGGHKLERGSFAVTVILCLLTKINYLQVF